MPHRDTDPRDPTQLPDTGEHVTAPLEDAEQSVGSTDEQANWPARDEAPFPGNRGPGDTSQQRMSIRQLLWLTALVEGSLLAIACLLAVVFQMYYPPEPLAEWRRWPWLTSILPGCLAGLVLFGLAQLLDHLPFNWSKKFVSGVERMMGQLFGNLPRVGLLLISIAAGVGEEMLFRWCLMGGSIEWIGWPWALIISSLVFGACHWVNTTYAITTTLAGVFLGGLMLVYDTVVVPMMAHACYDALALAWLTRSSRQT